MDEKQKSIWKKSWTGWRGLLLGWLGLTASLIIIFLFWLMAEGTPVARSGEESQLLGISWVLVMLIFLIAAFLRWLCCWRNVKRFLFGLACFATLIALFYAEENWRGKRAWENFKREWEAKGEHFDFASIIPNPVPDDQNFALTPVVASCYNYILTRDGKKIPSEKRDTNLVNRMSFDLGDAIDLNTNGTGSWIKGTLSDLQPWQKFYRELATKTNLFPVPPQPQTPAADVLLALSRYDKTLEELLQAGQLSKSRFPLDYETENPAEILLPHLAGLKRASLLLRLRAIVELQNGQSEKAAADVKLELRLIEAIRTEPFMISHLVRIAMNEILLQPIYEGLAKHQWADAQLGALDSELAKLNFLDDCQRVQKSEIACTVSEIAYLRSHRDYDSMFAGMGIAFTTDNKIESLIYRCVPSGWFFQSTVRECRILKQYGFAVEADAKTISPKITDQAVQAEKSARANAGIFDALRCFQQAFDADLLSSGNFLKKIARAQASVDLARTAIGLERYRLAHGKFPESLDTLAPQFIKKISHDVIGGEPLKYRRSPDGQFVLYSVGWNKKDDGGAVVFKKGSSQNENLSRDVDLDQGDWVWRYPTKE